MQYRPVLMAFVAIMVLASACGGAHHAVAANATPAVGSTSARSPARHSSVVSSGKWWRAMGVTTCAPAATVRVAGKVLALVCDTRVAG
jgi:hypothetical protein